MARLESVCVFCGSSRGASASYQRDARQLGNLLAQRGLRLVYGGGNVGLMGEVADAVLASGGQVLGVIPQMLAEREVAHLQLTELRIVESMHQRKAMIAEESDAFIALPGGIGTLEELFEVLTWSQLAIHRKPVVLVNSADFYTPLLQFLAHAQAEGFFTQATYRLLQVASSPNDAIEWIAQAVPQVEPKPFDQRIT